MKQYKKFTYIFMIAMLGFVIVNALIYNFATKKIFGIKKGYQVGDLARLSYDSNLAILRKNESTLSKEHFIFTGKTDKKIDVMVLGDSFTKGAGGGLNPYFQDYIMEYNNGLSVYTVKGYRSLNEFETIIMLLNSGVIDKVKPKYVILESVQEEAVRRFSKDFDFYIKENKSDIDDFYKLQTKYFNARQKLAFISNANFKYLLYNLLYMFNDRAYLSKVYKLKANEKILGKDYILVYKNNIRRLKDVTPDNVKKMNENLNKLSDLLAQKGVKLYFMPAPDKYEIYYDYLLNCKYPKSQMFEFLRKEDKRYEFIDTKAILDSQLKAGVKDLYFLDDTHWSNKASEAIFKKVKFD